MRGTKPFKVRSCGLWIGTHLDRPIVAIDFEPVPELMELNRRLLQFNKWQRREETYFHPHISLLFEDLTPANYERAKRDLQANPTLFDFDCSFTLNHVGIYAFDGIRWIEKHRIPLQ